MVKKTTTKQPKTVEVKMLIPYGLIVALAIAGAAYIAGWHSHQGYNQEVKNEAQTLVREIKADKLKK